MHVLIGFILVVCLWLTLLTREIKRQRRQRNIQKTKFRNEERQWRNHVKDLERVIEGLEQKILIYGEGKKTEETKKGESINTGNQS